MMDTRVDLVFIWIPGEVQPPELSQYALESNGLIGVDYCFESMQESADAAQSLRKAGIAYDYKLTVGGRIPWAK